MAFSYLPQGHNRRHWEPQGSDLTSHQENPVTLEWLSRMHEAIADMKDRVIGARTADEVAEKRGELRGLASALEILETISEEIRAKREDMNDLGEGYEGTEKVQ